MHASSMWHIHAGTLSSEQKAPEPEWIDVLRHALTVALVLTLQRRLGADPSLMKGASKLWPQASSWLHVVF